MNALYFKSASNFYNLRKSDKIALNFSPEFLKVVYINLTYFSAKASPVGADVSGST